MKLYAETLEGNAKGDTFHFVYLHRKEVEMSANSANASLVIFRLKRNPLIRCPIITLSITSSLPN